MLLGAANISANEELHTELLKRLGVIDTFQADFRQKTITRDGVEEATQVGHVAFLRPEKFLWVVSEPYEEQVVIVGNEMQVYDPDLQQLTHTMVDPSELSLANILIDPSSKVLEGFEIHRKGKKYTLSQVNGDSQLAILSLQFNNENIERVELVDHFGTKIEFRFFNIRLNEELGNDVFQLEIPPDTEIIGKGESANSLES